MLYPEDPGHDPAEFLWLLVISFFPILDEPRRSTLPPVFDGVELSPGVGYDCLILSDKAARQAHLAWRYGGYRKAGLKHHEALARTEADEPPR